MTDEPRVWSLRPGAPTPPPDAVRIDRSTKWGNPFHLSDEGQRVKVVTKYENWLMDQSELVRDARAELAGKHLLCWCAPRICHGDVLLRVANRKKNEFRLIIAGSRSIPEKEALLRIDELLHYVPLAPDQITEVVSGGARGPDRAGEVWAHRNNIKMSLFLADWDNYGKRAGVMRNVLMAEYVGHKGALLPIWDGESHGTRHMIETAKEHGLIVLDWRYPR